MHKRFDAIGKKKSSEKGQSLRTGVGVSHDWAVRANSVFNQFSLSRKRVWRKGSLRNRGCFLAMKSIIACDDPNIV
jgi:hypothetical protein